MKILIVEGFKNQGNGQVSPALKSGAITIGSYLVAVNDQSVKEISLKAVIQLLDSGPRPIVLRFQVKNKIRQ